MPPSLPREPPALRPLDADLLLVSFVLRRAQVMASLLSLSELRQDAMPEQRKRGFFANLL